LPILEARLSICQFILSGQRPVISGVSSVPISSNNGSPTSTPTPTPTPTTNKILVAKGDTIVFEENGKEIEGIITKYSSNQHIEIDNKYTITKDMITKKS